MMVWNKAGREISTGSVCHAQSSGRAVGMLAGLLATQGRGSDCGGQASNAGQRAQAPAGPQEVHSMQCPTCPLHSQHAGESGSSLPAHRCRSWSALSGSVLRQGGALNLCRYFYEEAGEEELADLAPGLLSQELREALGIAAGAPPPWLHRMQALGYPPGYRCGAEEVHAVPLLSGRAVCSQPSPALLLYTWCILLWQVLEVGPADALMSAPQSA